MVEIKEGDDGERLLGDVVKLPRSVDGRLGGVAHVPKLSLEGGRQVGQQQELKRVFVGAGGQRRRV